MVYHKGGGGSLPPPTAPAPPVTQTTAEVEQAKQEQIQQAARRKGYRSGLMGMSGRWSPAVPQGQNEPKVTGSKSLLGG